MPLDHISVPVSNLAKSKEFYLKALEPLGYLEFKQIGDITVGMGAKGPWGIQPDLWLSAVSEGKEVVNKNHIAFHAKSRNLVDLFFKAALEAGATSNGEPGLREQYHPNYYGAFVLDPDGHNLEAVCHIPDIKMRIALNPFNWFR